MAQFINLEELISLSLSVKMNKNANYTEKLSIFIDEISQNMQKKIKETDWWYTSEPERKHLIDKVTTYDYNSYHWAAILQKNTSTSAHLMQDYFKVSNILIN